MTRLTGFGITLLATAALGWSTLAHAQQAGGGAAAGSASPSGQQGPSAATHDLPSPQTGGFGGQQGNLGQQNAAGQQAQFDQPRYGIGQRPLPEGQGAIGQQRGMDRSMLSGGQPSQPGAMDQNERAELGVWLVASGGPGVEIHRITAGSPAEQAGLQPGDVILEINGNNVGSPMEVQEMIRALPIGEVAVLEVWRDGAQQDISATLQPVRERHQTAYRGGESTAANGELASRTMRLEEQLSMVMRELQQMRQELAQLRAAGSSQPAGGGIGIEQRESQSSPFEQRASELNPQPLPPEQPATQPAESAEPEQPANEPAEDLFGGETAQPESETAPATETETETKSGTDTDADSGSLFE